MHSMPQVHAAAEIGCIQNPNSKPVATTSSITTYDAEMRVWTTVTDRRCNRRLGRKLEDFGLIGGVTHQTTQILPANGAGFCIVYLWRQIIKSCLKELKNHVNGKLKLTCWGGLLRA